MLSSSPLILLFASVAVSQFVPRLPFYSPQEILLDYVDGPPQLPFSMDSFPSFLAPSFDSSKAALPSFGGSPKAASTRHFDASRRQPGVVPAFTGGFSPSQSTDPLQQPGVAPRFTGSFVKDREDPSFPSRAAPDASVESFSGSSISNPTATFLEGSHFERISLPKCRVLNCAGPVPNDGSFSSPSSVPGRKGSACSQVLVPINGCAGGEGYPMAMLCSVCCDCSRPLISQLLKTPKVYHPIRA